MVYVQFRALWKLPVREHQEGIQSSSSTAVEQCCRDMAQNDPSRQSLGLSPHVHGTTKSEIVQTIP